MPTVTVGIPTYNYGQYLSDAIESVLKQTYQDIEILVIDNCSTDNTNQIAKHYASHDSRVIYIRNDTNIGMPGNLNRCLSLARGEYVKILCADDILEPDCLAQSVCILEQNPQVVLVATGRQFVTQNLRPLEDAFYSSEQLIIDGPSVINRCLLEGNKIGEPAAVLFRKSCAGRGFDLRYSQFVDLEMWFHILEQGDFAFIPAKLCKFRHHENQGTQKNKESLVIYDDAFMLFNEYFVRPYVTATFIQKELAKFLMAYYAWTFNSQYSGGRLLRKIGSQYNIGLFLVLLVAKEIKNMIQKCFTW